jgi:AcrR family transcriptional regulator
VPRPRAQLDTAALARAFAADGLHGTSVERVAAAVRLAKPTLYQRGGDKEELFALAVEAEVERLIERLEGADRLSALAGALDDHLRDAPDGARLLLVTARHRGSRVAARVERSLLRIPEALAAALGGERERAELLAAALLGGAHAALDGGPPVRRLARLLPGPADEGPPDGIWTA